MTQDKPEVNSELIDRVYAFKSLETYHLQGRGIVYIVENPHDCDDFQHLIGANVLVNNFQYVVVAVERFLHCPPWRMGERIGLLVKEGWSNEGV